MTTPTKEAREKYVRTGGVRCLFCGSEQIEGGAFECNAGMAGQEVRCLDCSEEWIDVYSMIEVQNPEWVDDSPQHPKNSAGPLSLDLIIHLRGVDWRLLRKQKKSLLLATSAIGVQIDKKCQLDLAGILHLIDFIQDQAAEFLGENAVFGRLSKTKPRN